MLRFPCRLFLFAAAMAVLAPAPGQGATLISQDFDGPGAWPQVAASSSVRGAATATLKPAGTINVAGSTAPSRAVVLSAGIGAPRGREWSAALVSGLLPVRNTETDLGKMTLSFDHSVSSVRPVMVRIESFDARRRRTGGRVGVVYPAAPDFFLRAAMEVSTMRPVGGGAFRPTDPFVRLTFTINSPPVGVPDASTIELRVDNVAYTSPAFYVSPQGSDKNDGRTEGTALADPQKAVDAAQPGNIILLMDGTFYRAPTSSIHEGIIAFHHGGTPAAWIVVKNYPGQHPILTSDAWNAIKIGREEQQPPTSPALAYLEVRGLHIRGNGDTINKTHPELVGKVDPLTNGNGISGAGGHEINIPHHLRFADNLVEFCCCGGIGTGDCDWVTIENNTVRNNSWWTIYATSGLGFLGTKNFDGAENAYKMLIRNNRVSGNRCFVKWKSAGRFSDGNGIIIDSTYNPAKKQAYLGRTLVQNNLSFNNGGSGIHSFKSHQVDIVNNTAYLNGASPELRWGQIFVQISDDVRVMNNILVTRPDQPINSVGPGGDDQNSTRIVRANNVYFGGLAPKLTGDKDLIADPLFVNASTDWKVADFHVLLGSPALKTGALGALVPLLDLDGTLRPAAAPDRGAYQR